MNSIMLRKQQKKIFKRVKTHKVKFNSKSITIQMPSESYFATKAMLEDTLTNLDKDEQFSTASSNPRNVLYYITLRDLFVKKFSSTVSKDKTTITYQEAISLYTCIIESKKVGRGFIAQYLRYFDYLDQYFASKHLFQYLNI